MLILKTHLDRLRYNMETIFSRLVASIGDDVKEKKPDPMIYVTAAKVISLLGPALISCFPSSVP